MTNLEDPGRAAPAWTPPPPGEAAENEPPATPPPTPAPPPPGGGGGWSAGRVVAVVLGVVVALIGMGVLAAGGTALWADQAVRDDDGYISSSTRLQTPSYALASESVLVDSGEDWNLSERLIGDVRFRATSATSAPVFVGIAATSDARAYLADVGHSTVADLRDGAASYRPYAGGPPNQPPGDADIWVAGATGSGIATVEWPMTDGDWTVVVMNADGSRAVDVQAEVGATMPFLDWVPEVLLVTGAIVLVVGLALFVAGVVPRRPRAAATPTPTPEA